MAQNTVRASRRPALVLVTGVLGIVSAVVATLVAFLLIALGGLTADDGTGRWWTVGLVLAAAGQGWGAVRLLRRRGWRLLALASLPGMLPLAALVVVWMEYHQDPSLLEAIASIPVLTLVLTLTPPVRRWADPQPAAAEAGRGRADS
jgi:hypothetical protein